MGRTERCEGAPRSALGRWLLKATLCRWQPVRRVPHVLEAIARFDLLPARVVTFASIGSQAGLRAVDTAEAGSAATVHLLDRAGVGKQAAELVLQSRSDAGEQHECWCSNGRRDTVRARVYHLHASQLPTHEQRAR